jgi:hypothetical protein
MTGNLHVSLYDTQQLRKNAERQPYNTSLLYMGMRYGNALFILFISLLPPAQTHHQCSCVRRVQISARNRPPAGRNTPSTKESN